MLFTEHVNLNTNTSDNTEFGVSFSMHNFLFIDILDVLPSSCLLDKLNHTCKNSLDAMWPLSFFFIFSPLNIYLWTRKPSISLSFLRITLRSLSAFIAANVLWGLVGSFNNAVFNAVFLIYSDYIVVTFWEIKLTFLLSVVQCINSLQQMFFEV